MNFSDPFFKIEVLTSCLRELFGKLEVFGPHAYVNFSEPFFKLEVFGPHAYVNFSEPFFKLAVFGPHAYVNFSVHVESKA